MRIQFSCVHVHTSLIMVVVEGRVTADDVDDADGNDDDGCGSDDGVDCVER